MDHHHLHRHSHNISRITTKTIEFPSPFDLRELDASPLNTATTTPTTPPASEIGVRRILQTIHLVFKVRSSFFGR